MLNTEEIQYLRVLYAIIFEEDANNSKEFITFANGIPNPLRIKVEEWIIKNKQKMETAQELDLFVTNYIENNYD